MPTKKISKYAVNKALGKAKWSGTPVAKAHKKRKAVKKSTLSKRVAHKVATGTRHLEKAGAKGTGNVLRHLVASPAERRASIRRKTALH
jgi:hypothetical protein